MAPTITHSTYKKILIAFTIVISPQIEIHLYQAIQLAIQTDKLPSKDNQRTMASFSLKTHASTSRDKKKVGAKGLA